MLARVNETQRVSKHPFHQSMPCSMGALSVQPEQPRV